MHAIHLSSQYHKRRFNLTPMIDVIFLLLIFFMLTLQLESKAIIPLTSEPQFTGDTPRLITVNTQTIHLNGQLISENYLVSRMQPLLHTHNDIVLIRPEGDVNLQKLLHIINILHQAGIRHTAVVE